MDSSQRKLSVCFVADYSILIGGKERQLLEILKYLNNSGYIFQVISLSSRGLLFEKLKQYYNNQTVLIARSSIGALKAIGKLREFIKANKSISLYHTFDSLSALYLIIASLGLNVKIINGSVRHAGVEKSLNYLLDIILLKLSDIVIANSLAGLKYYHIRNGYVLYNAMDHDRFKKSNNDLVSIIMVANFSKFKDHRTFFHVTSELIKDGLIRKVGLAGDGPYLKCWKQYVIEKDIGGCFHFYGHTNTVEDILTEYGIGILCSTRKYKEGISNSILEYMSSGLLVIASDIGATKEIIEDRKNGLLFGVEDPNGLKNQILYAIKNRDKCEAMIANAYQTLQHKFDYQSNMHKLIDIYESIN